MRKNIIAGNWKMNNDNKETKNLVKRLKKTIKKTSTKDTRIIVSPSFVHLFEAVKRAKKSKIEIAAQNMHQAKNGAFTGEVSAKMLKSIDVKTVILGHSERRSIFGETDAILKEKVNTAIENNLEIIFCFGELLKDRKSDNHFSVVENQIKNALFYLNSTDWNNIILAYEPVWAIGTGETASPEEAQEMHSFVRKLIQKKYNTAVSDNTSILYGGSVKPTNAQEIFSKKDVDGGLIGGASLNAEDFTAILKSI